MPKHISAYRKACRKIEAEGERQCALIYSSAAIALYRHWNLKQKAIDRILNLVGETWKECAATNMRSMIEMCEQETGIEIQNGEGKSWRDLPYMNATLDTGRMTEAQWTYMRMQQVKWVAPQITACLLVALHRKYGFGFERCKRIYSQIQSIEAEFDMDPKKAREACLKETGVEAYERFVQKAG